MEKILRFISFFTYKMFGLNIVVYSLTSLRGHLGEPYKLIFLSKCKHFNVANSIFISFTAKVVCEESKFNILHLPKVLYSLYSINKGYRRKQKERDKKMELEAKLKQIEDKNDKWWELPVSSCSFMDLTC